MSIAKHTIKPSSAATVMALAASQTSVKDAKKVRRMLESQGAKEATITVRCTLKADERTRTQDVIEMSIEVKEMAQPVLLSAWFEVAKGAKSDALDAILRDVCRGQITTPCIIKSTENPQENVDNKDENEAENVSKDNVTLMISARKCIENMSSAIHDTAKIIRLKTAILKSLTNSAKPTNQETNSVQKLFDANISVATRGALNIAVGGSTTPYADIMAIIPWLGHDTLLALDTHLTSALQQPSAS